MPVPIDVSTVAGGAIVAVLCRPTDVGGTNPFDRCVQVVARTAATSIPVDFMADMVMLIAASVLDEPSLLGPHL